MLLVISGYPGNARAELWPELEDAGDLPTTAQMTRGSGQLTAIDGAVARESDQDMYLVVIADPASFSASTNNPQTNLPAGNDTQLFLFDESGLGILANDDDPDDPGTFLAAIPAGSFLGEPGRYLLAISVFNNDPVSADGPIFPLLTEDAVEIPSGPGGGSPILGWTLAPLPSDTGMYRIVLSGAVFAAPEPRGAPTAVALAVGFLAAGRRANRAR